MSKKSIIGIKPSYLILMMMIALVVIIFIFQESIVQNLNLNEVKKIDSASNKYFKFTEGKILNYKRSQVIFPNDKLNYLYTIQNISTQNLTFAPILHIKTAGKDIQDPIPLTALTINAGKSLINWQHFFIAHQGNIELDLNVRILDPENNNALIDEIDVLTDVDVLSLSEKLQSDLNTSNTLLVVFSGITAITTASYFGLHLKQQKKENRRNALLERFNKFNDPDSKQGRKILVNSQFTEEGDFMGSHSDYEIFKKELRELDTTAHLIKRGYIPKDEFLELLASIIIVTYDAVKPYIKFVQDKRETKYYASSFEWLYNEANNWWKENRPDEKKPMRDGI